MSEGNGTSAVGRMLPHSIEAEECLLAVCLLDGHEMVERCKESNITPESFYDSRHGILFNHLLDLYNLNLPIDIAVVAEELKASRQLDQIGGYSFLTQISSRIPTTAQASYFIEKVSEQALIREIIRSATGDVEDCYGYSGGGIGDLLTKRRERMDRVSTNAIGAQQLLRECEYKRDAKTVEEKVVFLLANIPMFTAGDLTNIVATYGVGKSAVLGALLAAAMTTEPDGKDFLGFSGRNYDCLPLLHFDTEQSASDYQLLIRRAEKRAGLKVGGAPEWLHSYHLTGKTPQECRQAMETAISTYARKKRGIYAVVLDGWADLVLDPNDSQEVFPFVARMHGLAIKHNMPIIGVLHLNPGSEEKSRGHLGSQIDRKAATILQLEMDPDQITTLWAKKRRGRQLTKDRGARFCWNNEKDMHTLVEGWSPEVAAAQSLAKRVDKKQRKADLMDQVIKAEMIRFFPASTEAKGGHVSVLHRLISASKSMTPTVFDRLRTEMAIAGLVVVQEGTGLLIRTKAGDEFAATAPGAKQKMQQEEIEL